jgi:single-strand DNA-binding protein
MANYNKIIMIGNLTRDPQMSYLPSNTPVVEFGLASNRRWKGQDGQQREDTCFVDCRAYGRQAETINQYTAKGRQILVEGRLQFDRWQDKDGQTRSKHRIIVENFQFLDSRPAGQGGGGGGYQGAPQSRPAQGAPRQQPSPEPAPQGYDEPPDQGGYDEPDFGDQGQQGDQIPF